MSSLENTPDFVRPIPLSTVTTCASAGWASDVPQGVHHGVYSRADDGLGDFGVRGAVMAR